jgi:hypothetical protein
MNCKETIEHINPIAWTGFTYKVCNKKAKYNVKYKDPVRGKIIEKSVCGVHFNQIIKNAERLKSKRNFDCLLQFEKI